MLKYDFLKNIPIFNGLSEKQLESVSQNLKLVNYKEGEHIIKEGDEGHELFIIYKGKVKVTKCLTMLANAKSNDDFDKSLNILDDSTHPTFGELALLHDNLRSATVTAVTDCQLLVLQNESFEKLAESDPLLGFLVMKNIAMNVADMLRNSSQDVLKLATAFSLVMKCEK